MAEGVLTIRPERFGRYILLDRIGAGGMAEVFRAVMPGAEGFRRTFVVKRILPPLCESPTFVEMFVREARIGALLNHPSIVQVYDFGNVDGQFFLAMEYLRGSDVLCIMRRLRESKQRFPVPIAAFTAHQVAGCLGYAHALRGPDGASLDIIHRDVTPSNIMCLRTGPVKLLDFGIAKTVAEVGAEHTEQGSFRGKLAYMAPERIRNEAFDARSDLYSLGVVLWEMLTGRRLFRGANDVETFKNVLEMSVPPPSSLRPEVPASLDRVVLRALARSAPDRYPTGQAMADELESILAETKFQSRMIGKLLVELFGSGTHSSQIALACLTPDLLAAVSESSGTSGARAAALDARTGTETGGRRRTRARRVWSGAAAAVAVTIVAIAALMGTRDGGGHSQAATALRSTAAAPVSATPPERTRVTLPELAQAVLPEPAVATTPPDAATARTPTAVPNVHAPPVSPPAPRARSAIALKRAATARARVTDDAIASGRSIDPFAEAARRGRR